MTSEFADIDEAVQAEFRASSPARLGIAVSGGSDSIALMHSLANALKGRATELFAVTVDHGLRPEAAAEAQQTAALAASLDISHETLVWKEWDGQGNLQSRARDARYELMTRWARDRGISVLAFGHTADDQAETLVMRLARSSGVDGLAGIPKRRTVNGITVVRPFLDIGRARLQQYLRAHSVEWADDPSNDDLRFDRVRARQTLDMLAPLGLTAEALGDVARNMASAREALDWYTFIAARDAVQLDGGDVLIELRGFRILPEEIARRLLVHALRWIGGGPYQPRRSAIAEALSAIRGGKKMSLHGCLILPHAGLIWICREYNAVRDRVSGPEQAWDDRWRVVPKGPISTSAQVRALGRSGLKQCQDWRQTGRPHAALLAAPAVWDGDTVLCAPQAGVTHTYDLELIGGGESFFASILSH